MPKLIGNFKKPKLITSDLRLFATAYSRSIHPIFGTAYPCSPPPQAISRSRGPQKTAGEEKHPVFVNVQESFRFLPHPIIRWQTEASQPLEGFQLMKTTGCGRQQRFKHCRPLISLPPPSCAFPFQLPFQNQNKCHPQCLDSSI